MGAVTGTKLNLYGKSNNLFAEKPPPKPGILSTFTKETNIEGVNNSGRSRGLIRKTVWLVIFLVLAALTVRDVMELVEEYSQGPVDVATTLSHENTIDFPSVTVCNKNRVSCRRLKQFQENFCARASKLCEHPQEIRSLIDLGRCGPDIQLETAGLEQPAEKPVANLEAKSPPESGDSTKPESGEKPAPQPVDNSVSEKGEDTVLATGEEVKTADMPVEKPLEKPILAEQADRLEKRKRKTSVPQKKITTDKTTIKEKFDTGEQGTKFKLNQAFLMHYLKLSEKERFMIGHQLRDMVKSCTFRGIDCLTTIDSDDDTFFMGYEVLMTPLYGNCFDIFAEDESFGKSSLTGASYGLVLELDVEQEDYLQGGQTVAAGARVSVQERAGYPLVEEYGVDVSPGSLTSISLQMVNITRHSYSNCSSSSWQRADTTYSYSVTGCQRFCVQRAVEEECGCSHPLLESGDLQPCTLTGKGEESQCVLGTSIEFDIGKRTCDCSPPCHELDYEKLISSTVLHGEGSKTSLRVEVYFMSLNVKSITETARYSLASFISTIGGSMGVWVGFSVCMVFEVIELLLDIIAKVLCY